MVNCDFFPQIAKNYDLGKAKNAECLPINCQQQFKILGSQTLELEVLFLIERRYTYLQHSALYKCHVILRRVDDRS